MGFYYFTEEKETGEKMPEVTRNLEYGYATLALANVLALISSTMTPGAGPTAPETVAPSELFRLLGLAVVGFLVLALTILSWVLRIMGWDAVYRATGKRLYRWTRIVIIILPIIGVIVMVVFIIVGVLEVMAAGTEEAAAVGPWIYGVLAGTALIALSYVFEGFSLLDMSYSYGSKLLRAGGILLIVAQFASIVSGSLSAVMFSEVLRSGLHTWLNAANNCLQLGSSILVFLGVREVKIDGGERA